MDVPPPPPPVGTVTTTIELAFVGAAKEPSFRLLSATPTDIRVPVAADGFIDLTNVTGWAIIVFKINDDRSNFKAEFPDQAVESLMVAENATGRKTPWRLTAQFADLSLKKKEMKICYTNNAGSDGFSRYGLNYRLDGVPTYYDPAIKNTAHTMLPKPPCRFF